MVDFFYPYYYNRQSLSRTIPGLSFYLPFMNYELYTTDNYSNAQSQLDRDVVQRLSLFFEDSFSSV